MESIPEMLHIGIFRKPLLIEYSRRLAVRLIGYMETGGNAIIENSLKAKGCPPNLRGYSMRHLPVWRLKGRKKPLRLLLTVS